MTSRLPKFTFLGISYFHFHIMLSNRDRWFLCVAMSSKKMNYYFENSNTASETDTDDFDDDFDDVYGDGDEETNENHQK